MPNKKRLILWSSDGPLNVVDRITEDFRKEINWNLKEAEEDPAFLNYAVAYFRCLAGIGREVGGGHMVTEHIPEWERRTLRIYDRMKFTGEDAKEVKEDRKFLVSIFKDLTKLCPDD